MNSDGDTGSATHARASLLRALPCIIGVGLLAWKAALLRIMPIVYLDTPWSIGPAFSMMRGDLLGVDFATYHLTFNQYPWLYFALAAGWFRIVGAGIAATHAFFFVLLTAQLAVIIHILRRRQAGVALTTLAVLAWSTSTYTYSFRFEVLGVTIVLLLAARLLAIDAKQKTRYALAPLLVAAAVLTHPAAGFIAGAMLATWLLHRRCTLRIALRHAAIVVIPVAILYLPIVLMDVRQWLAIMLFNEMHDSREMTVHFLLKYLARSPMIALLCLIAAYRTIRERQWWELAAVLAFILFLSYIGRSTYFPYLFPLLLMGTWVRKLPPLGPVLLIMLVAAAPLITHYLPMFWMAENPAYAPTLRNVLHAADSIAHASRTGRIYATAQIALELADRPATRLMYADFPVRSGYPPRLDSGDVILLHAPGAMRELAPYFPIDRLAPVRAIIPPVRGLRIYPYLFDHKWSDSLGLWMTVVTRTEDDARRSKAP